MTVLFDKPIPTGAEPGLPLLADQIFGSSLRSLVAPDVSAGILHLVVALLVVLALYSGVLFGAWLLTVPIWSAWRWASGIWRSNSKSANQSRVAGLLKFMAIVDAIVVACFFLGHALHNQLGNHCSIPPGGFEQMRSGPYHGVVTDALRFTLVSGVFLPFVVWFLFLAVPIDHGMSPWTIYPMAVLTMVPHALFWHGIYRARFW